MPFHSSKDTISGSQAGKKRRNLLTFVCAAIYFVSYMTRINYKAVISSVIETEGITKSDASAALTGLFITYGLGQLISGWLGDRVRPKYLITGGLAAAAVLNCLMPLSADRTWMLVIWSINGFAQAMMWPPIVKTLNDYLSGDDYVFAAVKVSWGSCFATILIYVAAPLFIRFAGWKPIFGFSAFFGIIGAVGAYLALTYFEKSAPKINADSVSGRNIGSSAVKPGMSAWLIVAAIWFIIVIQGALRDGVDAWMPTYLTETYGVATWIAVMTGVLMPLATLVFYRVAAWFSESVFHSEILCSGALFAFSGAVCGALLLLRKIGGAAASVACFVLVVGTMHGINVILTGIVPRYFRKYGSVSLISGILNCGTYVGSAIFTWGIAALSEKAGWDATIISWIIASLVGALCCFAVFRPWKRFSSR